MVLRPGDVGGGPVRHFDYFRRGYRETIWAEALGWLGERVA